MMRFIASTEVFHLVLITEVALPPPIFSLSLFLFFFFRSIVDDNREDWKAKRLSLISILCFFFSCLLELDLSFLYIRCISWQEVGKKRQR